VGAVTADGNVLGLARTPEFNDRVMSMEVGEISEPFETDKGWHIAHVEERRPEMMKPLEEVREIIEKQFVRETAFETRQSILDSMKVALNYEKHQDALDTYMAEIISENDLLSQARRTDQDPEKKIKLYEALLRRMPESPSCPEAQFMIGFVYAEELGDEKAAREALERVLDDYPDTEMASAARRMIEGFGEGAGAVNQDEGR
jgi:tetratricopeptide (TPR) repeat protein